MKKVHNLEVTAFSQLGTTQRYNYFVSKVFEWEEAWGLYDNGWVVSEIAGKMLLPLWPAEAFAKRCLINDWEKAEPKVIPLNELMVEFLPTLIEDKLDVAVFMVADSDACGVLPAQELLNDFITLQKNQDQQKIAE